MEPGRTGAISLLLVIVLVFGVLSYVLLKGPENGPIRERTSSDPYTFLLAMGGIPPTGSITGVIGLDVSIVDSKLTVGGSIPRLYVGGVFYGLYGEDGPLDLDELRLMGVELNDDRPFVLVDVTIEPVQAESGGPTEGSARIVSVDNVKEFDIAAAIANLFSDFSNRTEDLASDIELARLVLDPEMYNSVGTMVTCTYAGDSMRVVLDMQAGYEGPLDWYVVPYHLAQATYQVDDDGEATKVTLVAPRVASRGSGDLSIVLLTDTGTTRAGEEIRFMMALKNQGSVNYTAEAGPPLFDLNLYTKQGASMGSWSSGKGFPEYIERITLQPGEVLRQTILWDLMPLDPEFGLPVQMVTGNYQVAPVWVPEDLEGDGLPMWINASRPSLSLSWTKSGGFVGMNEELTISAEGDALVTNRVNLEKSALCLSPDEHWNLLESLDRLGLMELDQDNYEASGGAADFFSYELDIALGGSEKKIKWVDHWASMTPLPGALVEAGRIMQDLAKRVWADGSPMLD